MNADDVRKLVESQAQAWQAGDLEAIVADFAPDGVLISPGGRWQGHDDIRAAAAEFFQEATEVNIEVTRILIDGEEGAVEWTWNEERKDGTQLTAEDGIVFKLRDGKIVYWREYFDPDELQEQVETSRGQLNQDLDRDPLVRGEHEPYWFIGDQVVDIKLDGNHTGNQFLLLEVTVEPGGGAPQPHLHSREDETLMLLEGEVVVTIGGVRRTVCPGDVVWFPRGIPHSFKNRGSSRARGLGVVTPAGLETFFRELGVPKTGDKRPENYVEPDEEAVQAAADQVGMTLLDF